MSKVLVLKLSTGEEIIGDVNDDAMGNHINVEFGLLLNYQLTEDHKLQFSFLPYAPLVDKDKVINKNHVVWSAPPVEGLLQKYREATQRVVTPSSTILTPPKGLIIG